MKQVKMMILENCPHCKQAFRIVDKLIEEHPEYAAIKIEVIDERKEEEKTVGYDYWYVPTYFVNDIKVHEGVVNEQKIESVLKAALN